jgi:hypothetical protein
MPMIMNDPSMNGFSMNGFSMNGLSMIDMHANFFGWMLLINLIFLLIGHLKLSLFRAQVLRLAAKIYGDGGKALVENGPRFMMYYYLLVIMFNLVPYLALRIMA